MSLLTCGEKKGKQSKIEVVNKEKWRSFFFFLKIFNKERNILYITEIKKKRQIKALKDERVAGLLQRCALLWQKSFKVNQSLAHTIMKKKKRKEEKEGAKMKALWHILTTRIFFFLARVAFSAGNYRHEQHDKQQY